MTDDTDEDYAPVPTQPESREWAARMIAQHQFSWDTIAECARPDGLVLSQEGCDVVMDALRSCSVIMTWSDGQTATFYEEQR
jgi:hypothetical protein